MLKCHNCGEDFAFVVIVDGKRKNLQHRKYCLKCSPFGSGLRKRLPGDSRPVTRRRVRGTKVGDEVKCLQCPRMYVYDYRKGHRTYICNSCSANQKRTQVKVRAIAYKGGKCQECGYNKCSRALGFHHRNREEKEFTISAWMTKAWVVMQRELDKCDLLCANCHMEIEEEMFRSSSST